MPEIKVMHQISNFNLGIVFCFSGATLALDDNNLNEIFPDF